MKAQIRRLGHRWWTLVIPKGAPVSPLFQGRSYFTTFAEAVETLDVALRYSRHQRSAG